MNKHVARQIEVLQEILARPIITEEEQSRIRVKAESTRDMKLFAYLDTVRTSPDSVYLDLIQRWQTLPLYYNSRIFMLSDKVADTFRALVSRFVTIDAIVQMYRDSDCLNIQTIYIPEQQYELSDGYETIQFTPDKGYRIQHTNAWYFNEFTRTEE